MIPHARGLHLSNAFFPLSRNHLWSWCSGSHCCPALNPLIISHQLRMKGKVLPWPSRFWRSCALSVSPGNVLFSNLLHFPWEYLLSFPGFLSEFVPSSLPLWQLTGMAKGPWGSVRTWVLMKVGTVIKAIFSDSAPFHWIMHKHSCIYRSHHC